MRPQPRSKKPVKKVSSDLTAQSSRRDTDSESEGSVRTHTSDSSEDDFIYLSKLCTSKENINNLFFFTREFFS